MMNELTPWDIVCPYCGEQQQVLLDGSVSSQSYIEDCQVCCQPINFSVTVDGADNFSVLVRRDDE